MREAFEFRDETQDPGRDFKDMVISNNLIYANLIASAIPCLAIDQSASLAVSRLSEKIWLSCTTRKRKLQSRVASVGASFFE